MVDVDALLAQEVWQRTGRVLSAPLAIWPGMALSPQELGEDLQAAGYARVRTLHTTGDFTLQGGQIAVKPASGEPITVRFEDGRVRAVSPSQEAKFSAVELAELRGPEGISRRPISLDQLPEHVYTAILAMEDARFFDHEGVDPISITRAVLANTTEGGIAQGGSTITQQLVKNLFLTAERTYQRKAREALLAVALENTRSKREILELYVNEIYLGQAGGAAISGVDQAARAYFGKPAERLELAEAAVLAGIISAPNRYSPLRHPGRALERRDLVLERMRDLEWISEQRFEEETIRPLALSPTPTHRRSPWLVEAAIEDVEDALGEGGIVAAQGWIVETTLQPSLQRIAERVVGDSIAALEAEHDVAGAEIALVAVRASDGAVLAMVGGRDYATSQFNRVTSAKRQLGSTIKPLTYLAALDRDHTRSPASIVEDEPLIRTAGGQTWTPSNYDGRYKGPITWRHALAHSRNIPAVLIAEEAGMAHLSEWWQRIGLAEATAYPSAALGSFPATPLDLAGAYTVFPNLGTAVRPQMVVQASTADGVVRYRAEPHRVDAAGAGATWLAAGMMQSVIEEGTARSAARHGLSGPAAGKTGTTNDARDAWFIGYSGDIVVAVWVGHDRDKALGLTGATAALPAWTRFVTAAALPLRMPGPPDTLIEATLCTSTGLPPDCSVSCDDTRSEWVHADLLAECSSRQPLKQNPLREAISKLLGEPDPLVEPESTRDKEKPQRRSLLRRRR